MAKKCIFGPILSRRLGSSLGINLLPYKTCSLNCIYCECGVTTNLTTERKEYIPTQEVIESLKNMLPLPNFAARLLIVSLLPAGRAHASFCFRRNRPFYQKLFPSKN